MEVRGKGKGIIKGGREESKITSVYLEKQKTDIGERGKGRPAGGLRKSFRQGL